MIQTQKLVMIDALKSLSSSTLMLVGLLRMGSNSAALRLRLVELVTKSKALLEAFDLAEGASVVLERVEARR